MAHQGEGGSPVPVAAGWGMGSGVLQHEQKQHDEGAWQERVQAVGEVPEEIKEFKSTSPGL